MRKGFFKLLVGLSILFVLGHIVQVPYPENIGAGRHPIPWLYGGSFVHTPKEITSEPILQTETGSEVQQVQQPPPAAPKKEEKTSKPYLTAEGIFASKIIIPLFGGLVTAVVILLVMMELWNQNKNAQRTLAAKIFDDAVQNLGSKDHAKVLGAVYALNDLARTYPTYDHEKWLTPYDKHGYSKTVLETLCGFVRVATYTDVYSWNLHEERRNISSTQTPCVCPQAPGFCPHTPNRCPHFSGNNPYLPNYCSHTAGACSHTPDICSHTAATCPHTPGTCQHTPGTCQHTPGRCLYSSPDKCKDKCKPESRVHTTSLVVIQTIINRLFLHPDEPKLYVGKTGNWFSDCCIVKCLSECCIVQWLSKCRIVKCLSECCIVKWLSKCCIVKCLSECCAVKWFGKFGKEDRFKVSLRGADLQGVDFFPVGRDTPTIDWTDADLRHVNLHKASFKKTDLILVGANLFGANLSQADITATPHTKTDFTGAKLEGANLQGTILRGAILRGAILRGAKLDVAIIDGQTTPTNLSGADLSGANLQGACLTGAIFSQDADPIDPNMRGTVLTGADMRGVYICNPAGQQIMAYVGGQFTQDFLDSIILNNCTGQPMSSKVKQTWFESQNITWL